MSNCNNTCDNTYNNDTNFNREEYVIAIIDLKKERARLIPAAPLSWSTEAVEVHERLRNALIENLPWKDISIILFEYGCNITCNKYVDILLICSWLQMGNVISSLKYYITEQSEWESLFEELEAQVSDFEHSEFNLVNLRNQRVVDTCACVQVSVILHSYANKWAESKIWGQSFLLPPSNDTIEHSTSNSQKLDEFMNDLNCLLDSAVIVYKLGYHSLALKMLKAASNDFRSREAMTMIGCIYLNGSNNYTLSRLSEDEQTAILSQHLKGQEF